MYMYKVVVENEGQDRNRVVKKILQSFINSFK